MYVGHIYVHARNIHGEIVKSFTERPLKLVSVPSLGTNADRLADTIRHTPSTILRLHQTYLEARQRSTPHHYFIDKMVSYGMPRGEAESYGDMISFTLSDSITYRERMSLDVE